MQRTQELSLVIMVKVARLTSVGLLKGEGHGRMQELFTEPCQLLFFHGPCSCLLNHPSFIYSTWKVEFTGML